MTDAAQISRWRQKSWEIEWWKHLLFSAELTIHSFLLLCCGFFFPAVDANRGIRQYSIVHRLTQAHKLYPAVRDWIETIEKQRQDKEGWQELQSPSSPHDANGNQMLNVYCIIMAGSLYEKGGKKCVAIMAAFQDVIYCFFLFNYWNCWVSVLLQLSPYCV